MDLQTVGGLDRIGRNTADVSDMNMDLDFTFVDFSGDFRIGIGVGRAFLVCKRTGLE